MDNQIPTSASVATLPSYKKPPINEVVCGIRFHVLDKLRIPHVGLLWNKFRREYPIIQHAPPVASSKGEILVDNVTGLPLQRIWFINKSDDQLIQFQFDRFYFNWRRRQDAYPRYSYVIKSFEVVTDNMVDFFNEFELGELKPVEYELSYINHILRGEGWNTIDDLPRVFSDFVWRQTTGHFLPNPSSVGWQAEFPLPEEKGHLVANLRMATRTDDKIPLFVLTITARAVGELAIDKKAIREWFDVAHEFIVRGFTDLTTPEVQRSVWEREDA
jgi:uncharacterized protein (TIGR04255 family)